MEIKKNDSPTSQSNACIASVDQNKSKKTVTLLYAFCLTFGAIVGSGIFVSVKNTFNVFNNSQPLGFVILFWSLAGIFSLFGGLCYAELGTRIPESGGERAYYKYILNHQISKLFVIFYSFLIKAMSMSAGMVTVGKYISSFWTNDSNYWIERLIAIICLFLIAVNNSISKILALRLGFILTLLKILAILIVCGCGIDSLIKKGATVWEGPFESKGFDIRNFGKCLISLFYAFESWNTLGLVAGDMKNPKRDLPIAISFGVLAVVVFYVSAVISYSAVLGYKTVSTTTVVASLVAKEKLQKVSFILIILICCSALGASNCLMFTTSSVSASAGYSGELPKIFSIVHKRTRTPIFSIFVIFILSTCYIFIDLETVFNYCEFISWCFYFLSFLCLWIIKIKTRKELNENIFSVPYIIIILVQLVCVIFIGLSFMNEPIGCSIFAGAGLLLLGLQYLPFKYSDIGVLKRFEDKTIDFLCCKMGLELANESDFV